MTGGPDPALPDPPHPQHLIVPSPSHRAHVLTIPPPECYGLQPKEAASLIGFLEENRAPSREGTRAFPLWFTD